MAWHGPIYTTIMSLMVQKPEIDSIFKRQVCNLGGILRRRKRKISRDLETKKFQSEEKSSEKYSFSREISRFRRRNIAPWFKNPKKTLFSLKQDTGGGNELWGSKYRTSE